MSKINQLVALTTDILNKIHAGPYATTPGIKIGTRADLAIYLIATVIHKDDQTEFDDLVTGLQKVIHPTIRPSSCLYNPTDPSNSPYPGGNGPYGGQRGFGCDPQHPNMAIESPKSNSVNTEGHALLTKYAKAYVELNADGALTLADDIIRSMPEMTTTTISLVINLLRTALAEARSIVNNPDYANTK